MVGSANRVEREYCWAAARYGSFKQRASCSLSNPIALRLLAANKKSCCYFSNPGLLRHSAISGILSPSFTVSVLRWSPCRSTSTVTLSPTLHPSSMSAGRQVHQPSNPDVPQQFPNQSCSSAAAGHSTAACQAPTKEVCLCAHGLAIHAHNHVADRHAAVVVTCDALTQQSGSER